MKVLVSIAIVFLATSALAQAPKNDSTGQGYVFVAPGVGNIGPAREFGRKSGSIHMGAGGEAFIYRGLGIGVEIGAVGPGSATVPQRSRSTYSFGFSDYVVGLGSANLSYHFLPSTTDRKLEPFLTAGYSLFFRAGISHGYNVGGGLNVWLDKTVGTRFEIRDQESWYRETLSFRIGVTFR